MAVTHIKFDETTPHGRQLRMALNDLERGLESLNDVVNSMDLMKDGGVFNQYVLDRFGFLDLTKAQEAYDELNSAKFKLNTNDEVTDVNAALLQLFNKFR